MRYEISLDEERDDVTVDDYASLPFFRPWPYAHVVAFLTGAESRVCTHRSFRPLPTPHADASQLSALVTNAVVGAMRTSPPPAIDVSNTCAFVVDVDAAHTSCPPSAEYGVSARLCPVCAGRVTRAVAAIHTLVERMGWGRMIWFNSSSRGAHGYIVHPATSRIPHHLRANFARNLAHLTGTSDELDYRAAAGGHWIRMPGMIVERGVLAPIVDPHNFCPLTSRRLQPSDVDGIRESIVYAEAQIARARDDYAQCQSAAAAASRRVDVSMGGRKRVHSTME